MVVCWFFSPVTESAANKPAASRRSHLAAGDRVRQVGCQDSSSRLRHYSVGKLMHISLAVSMVRPISHHEHSEHKCLHLKVILVLHLPVRSAIRYQNTKHRMSSLHIFLGYGYGDQIGTGSGWHGDVQAVHPIFCPLQSTSKHAGSTQATFGFMAPYFRVLPDQLS